ncbi:MAG: DUF3467 domain-containing protein [Planctomycetota bacterium]
MAEPSEKPKKEAKDQPSTGGPAENRPAAEQQPPAQVQVDDSKALTAYANFYRVAGMAEELIVDLGLNTQPFGVPSQPIPISLRVVMNFYTAKRMMHALQLAVQRHEAAFGVLETDVQKRLVPGAMGTAARPPAG